jgi:hypothetical protein
VVNLINATISKYLRILRIRGYGFSGTLNDNPFEPDEKIDDSEHYLRMRDIMKMKKSGAQVSDERARKPESAFRGSTGLGYGVARLRP